MGPAGASGCVLLGLHRPRLLGVDDERPAVLGDAVDRMGELPQAATSASLGGFPAAEALVEGAEPGIARNALRVGMQSSGGRLALPMGASGARVRASCRTAGGPGPTEVGREGAARREGAGSPTAAMNGRRLGPRPSMVMSSLPTSWSSSCRRCRGRAHQAVAEEVEVLAEMDGPGRGRPGGGAGRPSPSASISCSASSGPTKWRPSYAA